MTGAQLTWIGKEPRGCGSENFREYLDFDIGGLGRAMGDLSKSLSLSWSEPPLMTLSPWDWALSTGLPAVCFRTGRLSTPWSSTSWLTDLKGMRSNPTNADSRLNVEPSHCWSWKRRGKCVRNEISSKELKNYFLYLAICKLWLTHELGRKLAPRFGWYLAAADWKNCRQNKIQVKPDNIYAMQTGDANSRLF